MTSKQSQRGAIRGDGITLLVAGVALGGLLVYSATSGYALPFWPAMAVIGVNLFAAGRLAWTVIKAKKNR
ncbi:hypothetical protein [Rhodoferax sp.]|uniref:hypothetical protein n=1 Tax=Rhodoferax sp. TaxID=50421 RepID=UPI00261BF3FC|nr:hypothetical protein [Rhodoferax sp.]MDD2809669.1 hypothetical protein [Rhodoferax sp.]MDD4942387.1 hypothetical protein [Rhodoferax sp.]MDD5480906.1 hypothetical protein [Rhodoferax sp.]